ncbi:MAG: PepSY domain-containing protein, partial [Pseudomonadales bacterium]|nr:PepSY domain-containing protein [Pseudomonadales bacterium]
KLHRWLGIVAAIQFIAWTGSGLYFALMPIEEIRGEHLVQEVAPLTMAGLQLIAPSALIALDPALADVPIESFQLKRRLDRPAYLVRRSGRTDAFNAQTGQKLAALTDEQAISVAAERVGFTPIRATYVSATEAGSEYRGGELPAWRVEAEDGTRVFVGAGSGQLQAIRTPSWRFYDFLWGFHIMDWNGREDFNHLLLKVAALLGLVTVLSGVALFISSLRYPRRVRG